MSLGCLLSAHSRRLRVGLAFLACQNICLRDPCRSYSHHCAGGGHSHLGMFLHNFTPPCTVPNMPAPMRAHKGSVPVARRVPNAPAAPRGSPPKVAGAPIRSPRVPPNYPYAIRLRNSTATSHGTAARPRGSGSITSVAPRFQAEYDSFFPLNLSRSTDHRRRRCCNSIACGVFAACP